MKTTRFIKKSAAAIIIIVSMLFIAFASRASDLSINAHKNNHSEEFHKALAEKGYTDISQFSITRSDVRQSKYFVNFVSDGYVYDAYFTKKGELIEVYKMAKI